MGLGDCDYHCICFGHSHEPLNKLQDSILYFNPGTARVQEQENKL